MKWTTKKIDIFKTWNKDEMQKNTIYYSYDEHSDKKGYVTFICPVCEKHKLVLPFEHGKTKDRWWHPENTWQFDITNEGFVMNPSVQLNGNCKGHFWFKQQEPRIYKS